MRLFVSNFRKIVIVWSLVGFSPHWILYSMISENPISTLLCRIRTDPDTVNFLELFIMFPGKDSSILLRYHPCAVIKTSGDQYRLRQIGLAYDGCHLLTYILYLYYQNNCLFARITFRQTSGTNTCPIYPHCQFCRISLVRATMLVYNCIKSKYYGIKHHL